MTFPLQKLGSPWWMTLCENVHSLPQLMEGDCGQLTVVHRNVPKVQEVILKSIPGDQRPLVTELLQHIRAHVSTQAQQHNTRWWPKVFCQLLLYGHILFVVDKVCAGDFAPSAKWVAKDTVDLLTYCFGLPQVRSPLQLYKFIEEETTITCTGWVNKETVSPYSILIAKQKDGAACLTL